MLQHPHCRNFGVTFFCMCFLSKPLFMKWFSLLKVDVDYLILVGLLGMKTWLYIPCLVLLACLWICFIIAILVDFRSWQGAYEEVTFGSENLGIKKVLLFLCEKCYWKSQISADAWARKCLSLSTHIEPQVSLSFCIGIWPILKGMRLTDRWMPPYIFTLNFHYSVGQNNLDFCNCDLKKMIFFGPQKFGIKIIFCK